MDHGNLVDVEVALSKYQWVIDIVHVKVFVRHIVDPAIPDVWTSPRFEPCAILRRVREYIFGGKKEMGGDM
jgi:hypothetical protein